MSTFIFLLPLLFFTLELLALTEHKRPFPCPQRGSFYQLTLQWVWLSDENSGQCNGSRSEFCTSSYALQIHPFWVSSVLLFPADWESERWINHFGCRNEILMQRMMVSSYQSYNNVYLWIPTWERKYEPILFKLLYLWILMLQKLFVNQYQQNRENYCKKMQCS